MNNHNFTNQSMGYQQQQQQHFVPQPNYPQFFADQQQNVQSQSFSHQNMGYASYSQAPPPPPDEQPPEMSIFQGAGNSQRGNFQSNNRGKQDWTRGSANNQRGGANSQRGGGNNQRGGGNNQRGGGNRGGQNFQQQNSNNNQFTNPRDGQNVQGGGANNKNRKNRNGNPNFQGFSGSNQNFQSTSLGGNQSGNQGFQGGNPSSQSKAFQGGNQQAGQNRQQPNDPKPPSIPVVPQAPAPKNDPPPAVLAPPTQEEIEFDEQFRKWEEEFDKWKQANVNHPDKNAYRQYEQQFETVRVKLLQRRNEMQQKKKEQALVSNPPKTAQQEKFESQWKAGDPKKEALVSLPGPSTSKAVNPPPITNPKDFYDDSFEDSLQHFDPSKARPNIFEKINNEPEPESFDSVRFAPIHRDFRRGNIPGLDIPIEEAKTKIAEQVIDLEPEEFFEAPNGSTPPMPSFKSLMKRPVTAISEIVDEPGRHQRAEKILILIRGAPGSGKTYLSNLILEKEMKMGNNRCMRLSIDKYFEGQLNRSLLDKHQEDLVYELRTLVRQGFYKFIIVEVEGGKLMYFNKYVHIAATIGQFKCYVIEIHQSYDVCMKFNRNKRNRNEVLNTIDDIEKYVSPQKTALLDPTSLMQAINPQPEPSTSAIDEPSSSSAQVPADLASNLASLLQDKNVMNLLQTQLNIQMQGKLPQKSSNQVQANNQMQGGSQMQSSNQMQGGSNQMQGNMEVRGNRNLEKEQQGSMNAPSNMFPQKQMGSQPMNLQRPMMSEPAMSHNMPSHFQQQSNFQQQPNFQQQQNFQQNRNYQQNQQNQNFQNFNQQQDSSFMDAESFGHVMAPNMQPDNFSNFQGPKVPFGNPRGQGKENFNVDYQPQPQEPSYDNCPTFTPAKIIDYKHVHMPTLAEQLLEFKVFRVIDYKHRTTANLREYVKDIEVDRIIERRKAVALRKKILEYLRSAERPEDTVSNPKYPRNWEKIPVERPPLKNKRKKKLTPKIKRILAQKESKWMTQGYRATGRTMELEEISSDDDEIAGFVQNMSFGKAKPREEIKPREEFKRSEETKPREEIVPIVKAPFVYKDSFKKQFNTIPNFNKFNHEKFVDIRSLLLQPARKNRPPWILIILRGAPGSGKSHLTQLIKRKELEMVSSGPRIISINDYFEDDEGASCENEPQMLETYLNQMVKFVEKTIKERRYEMIIVDAENVDMDHYLQFHRAGSSKGFTCFTIEMHQTLEYCEFQNIHNRSFQYLNNSIDHLDKCRIPREHTLLIPSALYDEYNCLVNPALAPKGSKDGDEEMDVDEHWAIAGEEEPSTSKPPTLDIFADTQTELPNFNPHNRAVIDLEDILEEPGRSFRDPQILIILRGPSGAGKTHLAGLIRNKEVSHGNSNVITLSIDDYFINPFSLSYQYESSKLNENMDKMLNSLKSIMQKRSHNFIIIDAEMSDDAIYMKFNQAGAANAYKCYLIELHQDASTCALNNVHNRTLKEIEDVLQVMKVDSIPQDHILLDPTYLYGVAKKPVKVDLNLPLKSALKTTENVLFPSFAEDHTPMTTEEVLPEIEVAVVSSKAKNVAPKVEKSKPKIPEFNWHNRDDIVEARDIFDDPGRSFRPDKVVIVLRGAPGSGKTYLANLIKRREAKNGNRAEVKIVSIVDYVESLFEPTNMKNYMEKLIEGLNSIMMDGKFKFIVVDADCCDLELYNKIYKVAEESDYKGFTIELNQDDDKCIQYCDHKRDEEIAAKNKMLSEMPTPAEHILLDPEYLYTENESDDDAMDVDVIESDDEDEEGAEAAFGPLKKTTVESKWDDDGDAPEVVIERLDGTRIKTFEHFTMAAFLQSDDEWTMRPSTSGKKRVRWADIEEKKEQAKMREIGFIVGQTDWKRMYDTSDGKSALEKTKYIEPRKK